MGLFFVLHFFFFTLHNGVYYDIFFVCVSFFSFIFLVDDSTLYIGHRLGGSAKAFSSSFTHVNRTEVPTGTLKERKRRTSNLDIQIRTNRGPPIPKIKVA